jgi:hypothetical protein
MTISATLAFDVTVPQHLVHRWAPSEVFLTDLRPEPAGYLAAARLPTSHTYFGDRPAGDGIDTMLLMECARQAATCVAHEHLGVPPGTMFLVTDWSLQLSEALATGDHGDRLRGPAVDPDTGRLTLRLQVTPQVRSGTVRGSRFEVELWLDAEPAGVMTINARYTPAEEAELVRRYHRKTPPPLSPQLPATPPGVAAKPEQVGRTRTANVVLFDCEINGNALSARLGTDPAHRGFYDHPQDHYPAMILLEAAGQAATALTEARVAGYHATFNRFAELDAPVLITATPDGGGAPIHVTFQQSHEVVAQIVVATRPTGPTR